jgi:putative MATE family efflux protein
MLGHGSGSIISRRLGSHDTAGAVRFASTSFFTALAAGSLLAVGGLLTLTPLMRLLGSTETILPHARAYGFYILLAAPIMMASLVMNNILRYEGKAFYAMIGLVTGGVLNMALDPLLMFGFGMGTAGAGAATALSQCVSFGLLLAPYLRGKTVSRFSLRAVTHSPREFAEILGTGLPSFGRQGLASFASMLLNVAARGYGDAAVAAMSIVSRIFMFLMSVVLGIGQGFQPVAAFNYGAREYRRVRSACRVTIGVSFVLVTGLIGVCWAFAPQMIRLFRDDPAVYAIALPAFRYQALAMFLQPVITTGSMLFQSTGKAGRATFLSCCRQGLFFIPLILLLPGQLGILGIEICQPAADLLTFFVCLPVTAAFLRELGRSAGTGPELPE